ncbi:hypothetical protein Tco_1562905 [Tanacetum coccineum]
MIKQAHYPFRWVICLKPAQKVTFKLSKNFNSILWLLNKLGLDPRSIEYPGHIESLGVPRAWKVMLSYSSSLLPSKLVSWIVAQGHVMTMRCATVISRSVQICGGNMEMEPDIENMTISEYLEYEAAKERRLWDDVQSRRTPTNYNETDVDSFHRNKKRIRKFFNVPDKIEEIVQPLIPKPIHTTPPNDNYVAPATKSILDELLEEFRDKILNVTMVDGEADFNPTKDLEELERLLAKEPQ